MGQRDARIRIWVRKRGDIVGIKDMDNERLMREYVFEKKMVAYHHKLLKDLEDEITRRFDKQ